MKQPKPTLAFWMRHAKDVDELRVDLEQKPNRVRSEDWVKFKEVVADACTHAVTLVCDARDAALDALADTIIQQGRGPRDATLRQEWDAWMPFKLSGKGNKSRAGYLGVLLEAGPSGPRLVAYVTPEGQVNTLAAAMKKAGLEPLGGVREQVAEGWIPIAHVPLNESCDLDAAIAECLQAFTRAKKCLGQMDG